MKYLKAKNILPEELISLIQEYVDGEFLYIPRKNGEQKAWGENSGSREQLKDRNSEVYDRYLDGMKINDISMQYFLSEQSIRRIISQERARCASSAHNCL